MYMYVQSNIIVAKVLHFIAFISFVSFIKMYGIQIH